jgi:hypothetical protein
MPKYAALIYNPRDLNGHENPAILAEYGEFMALATAAGVLVTGEPLEDVRTATTVQVAGGRKGGKVTMTDGPFAETKEILAGFFLLECPDLDDALRWAAQIPGAWYGKIEVRPIAEMPAG